MQKYLPLTGHVYDPAIIFMSADAFDELSADDKASFTAAAKLAGAASRRSRDGAGLIKAPLYFDAARAPRLH